MQCREHHRIADVGYKAYMQLDYSIVVSTVLAKKASDIMLENFIGHIGGLRKTILFPQE